MSAMGSYPHGTSTGMGISLPDMVLFMTSRTGVFFKIGVTFVFIFLSRLVTLH